MSWARADGTTSDTAPPHRSGNLLLSVASCFVIQLVRQVNYGHLESKRFFANTVGKDMEFNEVTEQDLITSNYQKVNS
jgi:hypothetical protein